MAKRPIPDVDPAALSQLADCFPDSGATQTPLSTEQDIARNGDPCMMEPPPMMSQATTGQIKTGPRGGQATTRQTAVGQAGSPSDEAPSGTGFAPSGRGAGFPPPPRAGGFPPPPQNVVPPPPPRKRSGGSLWSLFFALIALCAAAVAITAPSLRPELRAQLAALFPDLPQDTVNFLTGEDTGRMELTFNALDQRISHLTDILTRLEGLDAITPDQVRDLLLGEPLMSRLDALETGSEHITHRLQALDSRLTGLEDAQAQAAERINTWETALVTRSEDVSAALGDRIGSVRTAVGQVESSLTDSLAALSSRLDGLERNLETLSTDVATQQAQNAAQTADQTATLADLTAQLDALAPDLETLRHALDTVGTRVDTLTEAGSTTSTNLAALDKAIGEASTTLTALDGRVESLAAATETLTNGMMTARQSSDATMMLLEDLAKVVEATQTQRALSEAPLLGLVVLRRALNDNLPYQTAWVLSRSLLEKTVAATEDLMDVLGKNAGTGVRTLDDLRRDFQFIATQASKPIVPESDWTGSVASWIDYWFGDATAPVGQPGVRQRAMVDSIDDALEAGRLDLAIEEAVMLSTRTESVLLSGWIADARQRQAVETAFTALEDRVLETASTTPIAQSRTPAQVVRQ